MKTLLLVISLAISGTAFCGVLNDQANIFGPQAADVSNAIDGLPVWIETRVQTPPGGIKEYADAKAGENAKSFYVVITTQPRAWRVSMNPVGLASSETARLAGEQMTYRFKRGQFSQGAIELARNLDAATKPKPIPVLAPAATTAPQAINSDEISPWWIAGILGGAILFAIGLWWILTRQERNESAQAAKSFRQPADFTEGVKRPSKTEAQRVYDSYTPQERERLIIHHNYSPTASSDPFVFWMMINAMQPHYYPQTVYVAPSPSADTDHSHHSSPPPTPDYSGGSSFDSGGPSFDSGSSSSDSSGSGGSW